MKILPWLFCGKQALDPLHTLVYFAVHKTSRRIKDLGGCNNDPSVEHLIQNPAPIAFDTKLPSDADASNQKTLDYLEHISLLTPSARPKMGLEEDHSRLRVLEQLLKDIEEKKYPEVLTFLDNEIATTSAMVEERLKYTTSIRDIELRVILQMELEVLKIMRTAIYHEANLVRSQQ